MNIKKILAVFCCIALLAGCQQAEEIENPSEKLPMSVEASIGNSNAVDGRYVSSDNTHKNLSFSSGDKIGIFVSDRAAAEWTNSGSAWTSTSPIYWPSKGTEYDFYAFYPYVATSLKDAVPMPSISEQEGQIEYLSKYDFLVATAKEKYETDNGKVSFTSNNSFYHASSLITITIDGTSDLKTSQINKISFEGTGIASATTYSFESSTATPIENESSNTIETPSDWSYQMENKNKTFYFIANTNISLSNVTFTIEYATGETPYKASKSNLGSATLEKGKEYSFNLNITDGVLSITGNEITDWENGGTMNDITINGVEQTSSAS